MASNETAIVNDIMLALSKNGVAIWKNVRGKFRPLHGDQNRVIAAGLLSPGASDLIGLMPITITQDMVGQRVAVFMAIEVKTSTGSIRPEQTAFIDKIRRYGGISGVARSADDAAELISARSCKP